VQRAEHLHEDEDHGHGEQRRRQAGAPLDGGHEQPGGDGEAGR
jgi:hypothetical protein